MANQFWQWINLYSMIWSTLKECRIKSTLIHLYTCIALYIETGLFLKGHFNTFQPFFVSLPQGNTWDNDTSVTDDFIPLLHHKPSFVELLNAKCIILRQNLCVTEIQNITTYARYNMTEINVPRWLHTTERERVYFRNILSSKYLCKLKVKTYFWRLAHFSCFITFLFTLFFLSDVSWSNSFYLQLRLKTSSYSF